MAQVVLHNCNLTHSTHHSKNLISLRKTQPRGSSHCLLFRSPQIPNLPVDQTAVTPVVTAY